MSEKKEINHGGPAFPVKRGVNIHLWNGMYLRDYFAAHAPEVPEYWQPQMEECPYPEYNLSNTGARRDEIKSEAQWEWINKRNLQRIIQWPYYYADQVLATRSTPKEGV